MRRRYWLWAGGSLFATIALCNLMTVSVRAQTSRVLRKNHILEYGSYVGGFGDDQARGVGFTSDNSVLVCGNFANLQTRGVKKSTLLDAVEASPGKLLKLSADGQKILNEVAIGDRIDDCQMWRDPGGSQYGDRLVVGGTFGVAMINPAKMQLVWSAPLNGPVGNGSSDGGQTRVSIDSQKQAVALRNNVVTLFNHKGEFKFTYTLDRTYATDIVMDPYRRQLYVVGFANRRNVNDSNNPVQIPFMYALDSIRLGFLWRTWDYDANLLTPSAAAGSAPNNNMADSRLYRVTVGGDGQIAVLGESAGGNSVFRWDGQDFITPTLVKYDAYSDTYNSSSTHMLYYAKVDAGTGVVMAGQYAVPRLSTGKANTFRARDGAIASDANGNLIIGGLSFSGTPERNENNFSGEFVGPYAGGDDMMLLQVSADLKTRIRWTPLARQPGGGGMMSAVDAVNDRIAVFGTSTFGNLMTTGSGLVQQPFDPDKTDGRQDAYLGVLSRSNE